MSKDNNQNQTKQKLNWQNIAYQARHLTCWTILSAGTIAYIVQNSQRFLATTATYIVAGAVVGLLLYFGNKR